MMCHSTSTEGLVESFSIEPTALEDFKEAPDSLCTGVLLTDEDAKVHYNIFIQVGCVRLAKALLHVAAAASIACFQDSRYAAM